MRPDDPPVNYLRCAVLDAQYALRVDDETLADALELVAAEFRDDG